MSLLTVERLSKTYPGAGRPAVDAISFTLAENEILALVGPSGCGKTTTLRLVAGLERPDDGAIRLYHQTIAGGGAFVPPERRGLGMVFQDHALFPHLTVAENVAFGLRGQPRPLIQATVAEMLGLVGLQALAGRYPHALSGGERQRVALARALAPCPALVLMDEPFSSLDADMRLQVRQQVRDILKARRASVIFVTHDQDEALFMGDQLGVFHNGRLEQLGTPEQIFHASATRFVAEFMGSSDFLPGRTAPGGIQTEVGLLPQPAALPAAAPVEVALRADDVDFQPADGGNAMIARRFFRGAFNLYQLQLDSGQVLHAFKEHTVILPVGQRVQARISAGHPLVVFHQGQVVGASANFANVSCGHCEERSDEAISARPVR